MCIQKISRGVLVLGVLGLGLSACGGGDGSDAGSAEVAGVVAALVKHYKDPDCTDLTEGAQQEFGYGPGPDCEKIIDQRNPPKDVTVTDAKVSGDEATAVVEGFTFGLMRQGGGWIITGGK